MYFSFAIRAWASPVKSHVQIVVSHLKGLLWTFFSVHAYVILGESYNLCIIFCVHAYHIIPCLFITQVLQDEDLLKEAIANNTNDYCTTNTPACCNLVNIQSVYIIIFMSVHFVINIILFNIPCGKLVEHWTYDKNVVGSNLTVQVCQ